MHFDAQDLSLLKIEDLAGGQFDTMCIKIGWILTCELKGFKSYVDDK